MQLCTAPVDKPWLQSLEHQCSNGLLYVPCIGPRLHMSRNPAMDSATVESSHERTWVPTVVPAVLFITVLD
jgi:hypothetical protein